MAATTPSRQVQFLKQYTASAEKQLMAAAREFEKQNPQQERTVFSILHPMSSASARGREAITITASYREVGMHHLQMVGLGKCATEGGGGRASSSSLPYPSYQAQPVSLEACQDHCVREASCEGVNYYDHNEKCRVYTTRAAAGALPPPIMAVAPWEWSGRKKQKGRGEGARETAAMVESKEKQQQAWYEDS